MDSFRRLIVIVTLLLVLFVLLASGAPDITPIYLSHQYEDMNPVSAYQEYAHLVRRTLIEDTQRNGYNYFFALGLAPVCYGHAACSGTISAEDCITCLRAAQTLWLSGSSINYFNGIVNLADCRMRWARERVDANY